MSQLEPKRIRVDWEELEEAFADGSRDHRYYLDRETGAVHFFSAYLDNDDEEDERTLTTDRRYVLIPYEGRIVTKEQLVEFVSTLEKPDRQKVEASLIESGGVCRVEDVLESLPAARTKWRSFAQERLQARIKNWLSEVAVEPL